MTQRQINKIGLEAEVFVFNSKNNSPVFPEDYDLPTDEFALLGEIRGDPGENAPETLANFMKAYYDFREIMKGAKDSNAELYLDFTKPSLTISQELYTVAIKKSGGAKFLPTCSNIYNTDINKTTDLLLDKEGTVLGHKVGCGLHIHFSSEVTDTIILEEKTESVYTKTKIPILLQKEDIQFVLDLYKKEKDYTIPERKLSAKASLLTKPVIRYFIEQLDKKQLPKFTLPKEMVTRYRQKGFYEMKSYGFEYRSLPFSDDVYASMEGIVEFCFNLLDEL